MGGFRKSDVAFQREQAEKLRLVRDITRLSESIGDLRLELNRILKTSTTGIRETFREQVLAASGWSDAVETIEGQTPGMETAVEALTATAGELNDVANQGAKVISELSVAITQKGDEVARELGFHLANVRTLVAAHRSECGRWFSQAVEEWDHLLREADESYDDENYLAVRSQLDRIEAFVRETSEQSQELSEKQQSRLYLLQAVRQVCCNLGMRETTGPSYEDRADPTSRILLTMTSADQGNIQFWLSLDGIHTHGESERCFHDLDSISTYLADEYGIGTKFRSPTDDEQPELRNGRSRRLCDEADAYRSA